MPDAAPDVMVRSAMQLQQAGRFAEAAAAYEHLLARWPDLPNCWYNLALMQRKAGRFDAALASYRQALDRGATRPEEIHLNRGVIYADCLRKDDAAESELNTALRLNPDYVPALLNLGNLSEDRGRREAALALYERIITLDPACFEALSRYANLSTVATQDDPLIGRLRQAISGSDASAADKASLGFTLGKLLDGCGAYGEAFNAYVSANRRSRESAPQNIVYDRRQHEQFIDRLIEMFPRDRSHPSAPVDGAPTIFICGMFRSGSTLAEQVLSGHRRITAGGEIGFLPACVASELSPFPQSMKRIAPSTLADIAARYAAAIAKLFPGADIVTDKRPDNFLYTGLIKTLFPDAKLIHTVRSPLDNCLSVFFLHLDHGMGYALDLEDIGHYYRQYRRLMEHWEKHYGDDIFRLDYDAFVRQPEPVLRKLLEFCNLEWDENCLTFDRRDNAVKTASVWQVREPLYQRASGRWRHYEQQLAPLRACLGPIGGD